MLKKQSKNLSLKLKNSTKKKIIKIGNMSNRKRNYIILRSFDNYFDERSEYYEAIQAFRDEFWTGKQFIFNDNIVYIQSVTDIHTANNSTDTRLDFIQLASISRGVIESSDKQKLFNKTSPFILIPLTYTPFKELLSLTNIFPPIIIKDA